LALAPPAPPPTFVGNDALPQSLRGVEILAGCAADYDVLLGQGDA
jgi:hypothetical protein